MFAIDEDTGVVKGVDTGVDVSTLRFMLICTTKQEVPDFAKPK
jgi:hypothetical protein